MFLILIIFSTIYTAGQAICKAIQQPTRYILKRLKEQIKYKYN